MWDTYMLLFSEHFYTKKWMQFKKHKGNGMQHIKQWSFNFAHTSGRELYFYNKTKFGFYKIKHND